MAYIMEQAGGMASTGLETILDIQPDNIHQRSPVAMGSPEDVLEYIAICKKHAKKWDRTNSPSQPSRPGENLVSPNCPLLQDWFWAWCKRVFDLVQF